MDVNSVHSLPIVLFFFYEKETHMHVDESKKFDKRNIERNIKDGVINPKDYEIHLARLPDASDKIFLPEDDLSDSEELESSEENEISSKKKGLKKKATRGR